MNLSPYRRPNGRVAFHTTAREHVASIQKDGIRQSAACNSSSKTVTEALAARGYEDPSPFERDAVVYCHLDGDWVEELAKISDEFANDDLTVVVDLELVSAPLYLADESAISDLIDHHVAPNAPTATETFDEAVQRYRESIVRLDGGAVAMEEICTVDGGPELVVDGDVPADAVVDVRG